MAKPRKAKSPYAGRVEPSAVDTIKALLGSRTEPTTAKQPSELPPLNVGKPDPAFLIKHELEEAAKKYDAEMAKKRAALPKKISLKQYIEALYPDDSDW